MQAIARGVKAAVVAALCWGALAFAAERKEFKYQTAPGAAVTVVNENGPITVRPGAGRQVVITADRASEKAEIEANQSGNRIEVRTRGAGLSGDDGRVEYTVQVPPDTKVNLHSGNGTITVERLRADVTAEGDSATVEVRDCSNGHVHVRTVKGPVRLSNIVHGHVEITTVSGDVTLNSVSGHLVQVNSTGGRIAFQGEFGDGGEYVLSSHTGDIEVKAPASSPAIAARSVKGNVENDFAQPVPSTANSLQAGADAARKLLTKSAQVTLRSFSGKIRAKKQ